jgi:hypothetical protein
MSPILSVHLPAFEPLATSLEFSGKIADSGENAVTQKQHFRTKSSCCFSTSSGPFLNMQRLEIGQAGARTGFPARCFASSVSQSPVFADFRIVGAVAGERIVFQETLMLSTR